MRAELIRAASRTVRRTRSGRPAHHPRPDPEAGLCLAAEIADDGIDHAHGEEHQQEFDRRGQADADDPRQDGGAGPVEAQGRAHQGLDPAEQPDGAEEARPGGDGAGEARSEGTEWKARPPARDQNGGEDGIQQDGAGLDQHGRPDDPGRAQGGTHGSRGEHQGQGRQEAVQIGLALDGRGGVGRQALDRPPAQSVTRRQGQPEGHDQTLGRQAAPHGTQGFARAREDGADAVFARDQVAGVQVAGSHVSRRHQSVRGGVVG